MTGNTLAMPVQRNSHLIRCENGLLHALDRKYDAESRIVWETIRESMTAPQGRKRRAEFHS